MCVYREVDISLILDRYRYGSFQGKSSTKPSKMHCEFCVTFQKGKHISTPDQESGAWHSSTSGEIIKKVRSGALHEVQTTTPKRVRIESRIKKGKGVESQRREELVGNLIGIIGNKTSTAIWCRNVDMGREARRERLVMVNLSSICKGMWTHSKKQNHTLKKHHLPSQILSQKYMCAQPIWFHSSTTDPLVNGLWSWVTVAVEDWIWVGFWAKRSLPLNLKFE